jgi:hypothetical protein
MKSHINESVKWPNEPQKRIIIKRKNNSLIINNPDLYFDKTICTRNTKKINKSRRNSTKESKNGKNVIKKALNPKFYLNTKIPSYKENNLQTINTRSIKTKNNKATPPKKAKIKILKKKGHKCQRNNSCSNIINDNNINDKLIKEKKITNNFSISTGLTGSSGDRAKNFFDSEESRNFNVNNYNYNADSHSNKLESLLFDEKVNNINNFCYETISKEDSNENEDKVILKCDNYSMLTFGNSFSYSNSQKRKTNRKFLNNDNKKSNNKQNDVDLDKLNDNSYVNKLKLENETLKKELEESAQQISFLMHQIKDLKDNTYLPTKKPRKKNIHRNISVKENKTKEIKDTKLKILLLKKHKLNNNETNINKKITKSNSIIINSKKNKNNNKTNIHKKIYSMKNSVNAL